jgi:putative phage-type endonuclease
MTTLHELATPAARLVLSADASRTEWLAARRRGLGGSDALAVLGLSRFSSRYSVWAEKSGLLKEQEDREAMRWGRLLEPVIAHEFEERTGIRTRACGLLQNVERPWQLASVDRETDDGGILEIKTTSQYLADDWDDDQVADAAEAQLQHYLSVTGREHGYAAVLIGGQRMEIRHVRRDERLIGVLVEAERELWQLVLDGTPPALDGSQATSRALAELYPHAVEHGVQLDAAAVARLRADQGWAEEIKALKAARDQVRAETVALMGEADVARHGDRIVATWKNTGAFDAERFAADHPDIAARHLVTETRLDTEAVKAAHPDLHARYRGRVFRPVKKGLR